ncbi:uncharacterized protein [Lolium perenne]|uniref:uncharacterized protein isoform X1 n=1 Tax=Lolium perenne TaxID=4522 RepID=UPI003A99CF87
MRFCYPLYIAGHGRMYSFTEPVEYYLNDYKCFLLVVVWRIIFYLHFAKEYQKHMTGMEEDLPALGLERLKEMIKKCQATPCSPQGLGDERDVAVPGGSQCSGASHCYGTGSRRLTRSRTLTGSPSSWRSSLGR